MPTLPRLLAPVAVGGLVLVVTATLNGCASVSDAVMHRFEDSWSTAAAAEKAWPVGDFPSWIPDDATGVHAVGTDDASAMVVRITTDTALPGSCAAADRRSVPFTSRDWIPKTARTSDEVSDCGDYQIVKTDDGWIGWYVEGEGPEDGTPTPSRG